MQVGILFLLIRIYIALRHRAGIHEHELPAPVPPPEPELHDGGELPTVEVVAESVETETKRRELLAWKTAVRQVFSSREWEQIEPAVIALYEAWRKYGGSRKAQFAYVLASVEHECGFVPQREKRARIATQPELWAIQERYWPSGFYGRGLIQLTWRKLYERFSKVMGVDLVANPNLLITDLKLSAEVTVIGMLRGWFTGRGLSDYIREDKIDYENARRIVNGDVRKNGEKIASAARLLLMAYEEAHAWMDD